MARLLLTMAATQPGEEPITLPVDLDEATAQDRAAYLNRLRLQYRAPFVTLRDRAGAEVCEVDLRRLLAVAIDPNPVLPVLP